jgi:CYTH domain-containing protein
MIEIERKFLIKDRIALRTILINGKQIRQGYLFTEQAKSCRVRVKGAKGFLTLKFGTDLLSRNEFEYEIPFEEACELLSQCDRVLQKTRYEIPVGNHVWEIDVFSGALDGLILAEIELSDADETIQLPSWVGEEVTHDPTYLNVNLINGL